MTDVHRRVCKLGRARAVRAYSLQVLRVTHLFFCDTSRASSFEVMPPLPSSSAALKRDDMRSCIALSSGRALFITCAKKGGCTRKRREHAWRGACSASGALRAVVPCDTAARGACVRGAHREELAEVDEAVSACVDEVEQLLQLVLDHGLMANLPRGREVGRGFAASAKASRAFVPHHHEF